MTIWIICKECGSHNVRRDAWAEWDVTTQTWTLGTVFDAGHCEACEGEANLDEVPVTGDDDMRAEIEELGFKLEDVEGDGFTVYKIGDEKFDSLEEAYTWALKHEPEN